VTALVLAVALGGITGTSTHQDATQQCRFDWLDHQTWTSREEHRTARCVLDRWAVPGGLSKFDAVIDCESGWSRFAYNTAGPYVGLAQHALSSWRYRVRAYKPTWWTLKPRWSNPRTAIVVTARMVIAQGWGAWSCA
jgi:hypothetical protein